MASFALHETVQLLITIGYGIWRKRWYALATASIFSAVGWTAVHSIPNTFEASARVQVNADIYIKNLTSVVARNNASSQRNEASIIRNRLTQRSSLEKIIRRSNYLERLTPNEAALSRVIAQMKRGVNIFPSGENIYTITYENSDDRLTDAQRAEVVKEVVDNLVSVFAAQGRQTEDVSRARNVIELEIARLREELEKQDDAIGAFQRQHYEILRGKSIDLRLEEATEVVLSTTNEIAELQAGIAETAQALAEIPQTIQRPSSAGGAQGDNDPLMDRIQGLREDLDKVKASGRKDKHPDVLNIIRQIESLEKEYEAEEKKREEELRAAAESGRVIKSNEIPNPNYEKLFGDLVMDRKRVTVLEKRLEKKSAELNDLRAKAEIAPDIKNEYDRLRQSGRAAERKLQELESKREDLNIVDASSEIDSLNFQTLEEPIKPLRPSGPPRMIYLTVPLVGGLMVGIAVAFILSQIKPVIITIEQLRHNFDLPVLGNVTRVLSEKDSQAQFADLLLFGAVGTFLVLVYIGLILVNMFGV